MRHSTSVADLVVCDESCQLALVFLSHNVFGAVRMTMDFIREPIPGRPQQPLSDELQHEEDQCNYERCALSLSLMPLSQQQPAVSSRNLPYIKNHLVASYHEFLSCSLCDLVFCLRLLPRPAGIATLSASSARDSRMTRRASSASRGRRLIAGRRWMATTRPRARCGAACAAGAVHGCAGDLL